VTTTGDNTMGDEPAAAAAADEVEEDAPEEVETAAA
jgi:hypothetical protein